MGFDHSKARLVAAYAVTSELRSLIAASPKRFDAEKRPRLAAIYGLTGLPSAAAHEVLLVGLKDDLRGVDTTVLWGHVKSARVLHQAIATLLQADGDRGFASMRRQQVFADLGLKKSLETLRRPDGPEFDLLLLLGKRIVDRAADADEDQAVPA